MNLDDLMVVWRSQDAAPLHDVDKTLLHLALRQDEAKMQRWRRRERIVVYLMSAACLVGMTIFLIMMTYDDDPRTAWDFAIPVVGAIVALLTVRAVYVTQRGQALREQHFGESLRDQLKRSIAQLEHQATRALRTYVLVIVLLGGICPIAITLAGWRVNNEPFSTQWVTIVGGIFMCVFGVTIGIWELRRQVQLTLLPRRRQLEELLKEFGGEEQPG